MEVTNPGSVNVVNQTYGNPSPNGTRSVYVPRVPPGVVSAANAVLESPDPNVGAALILPRVPGLTDVADETYGNPDPNVGAALILPRVPGLTDVADETYGNPDPNGGAAYYAPRELDVLTPVADEGFPLPPDGGLPQEAGAEPVVFPTPEEVVVGEPVFTPPTSTYPSGGLYPSQNPPLQVADQPPQAPGTGFTPPAELTVVGPRQSFQTNLTADQIVTCTVTNVLDADTLQPPSSSTTRYYVAVSLPIAAGKPNLKSYPISLLGRLITFSSVAAPTQVNAASYSVLPADDVIDENYTATAPCSITLPAISTVPNGRTVFVVDTGGDAGNHNITVNRTGSDTINGQPSNYVINVSGSGTWFTANAATGDWQVGLVAPTSDMSNQGACRTIQNYGTNFVTIPIQDTSDSNGDVELLVPIFPGDQFTLPVNRQGSEQVNTAGTSIDVTVAPPPPVNLPNTPNGLSSGYPSGTQVPTAANVNLAPRPLVGGQNPLLGLQNTGLPTSQLVPTAAFVQVPDECPVVGLPRDVFV